jgi:hypothetical protein
LKILTSPVLKVEMSYRRDPMRVTVRGVNIGGRFLLNGVEAITDFRDKFYCTKGST